MLSDWEKFLERRKANIGFITRGKAFREPTKFEMNQALNKEIQSWQDDIGKRPFHVGTEYSLSRGYEYDINPDNMRRDKAIEAYIKTPMDKNGILASEGVDVEVYKWEDISFLKAIFYWIIGRKIKSVEKKND